MSNPDKMTSCECGFLIADHKTITGQKLLSGLEESSKPMANTVFVRTTASILKEVLVAQGRTCGRKAK